MSARPLCILLASLCVASAAQAQQGSARLSGVVTDAATGRPLPGAAVVVPGLDRGAATDPQGRYALDGLPRQRVAVEVRFLGYETLHREADLTGGAARLDAALRAADLGLGEVRVEADASRQVLLRDARSASVLDARRLEETRGQTLGQTLDGLAGVTALTTGPSISKPVVRGLHSERVIVLNNGVPQEGQQWGGEHGPEIDPFAPQTITVIKGAAGVEYGAGAIGGVIRLEDRPLPETPGLSGRFSTQAFSNSGQGAASLAVENAEARVPGLTWRFQGSARRAGDARTPGFVMRNSAFAEAAGALAVGYARGPLTWEAHASHYATELGIYRGSHFGNARNLEEIIARGGPDPAWGYRFSYAIEAPKQTIGHTLGSLHLHADVPLGELDVQYGVQRNVRREFDAHRRFGDAPDRPAFDLTLTTHTLDARLARTPSLSRAGVAGLSAMAQANANGASGYLIPNFQAVTGGAFARETWLATSRLTLEAGARLDVRWMRAFPYNRAARAVETRHHAYASPSAALSALYALGPAWSVTANLGTAWRPPGVNELYADGVHHGSARYERGDDSLVPERSVDASATLRHESRRASAEVSAYANRIGRYLYLLEAPAPVITIRGAFPLFAYAQDDALLRGLDADLTVRPTGGLELGARASVLRAENLALGGPLYGMPSDRLALRARTQAGRWGPFRLPYAEADVRLVRRQDRIQPGAYEAAPPPPGYALTGLRVGTDLALGGQPATLSLAADNLFDVRYRDYLSRFRYFIDEPGRNVVLRLSVPFGRPGA